MSRPRATPSTNPRIMRNRSYYWADPEKHREKQRIWKSKNRDKVLAGERRRNGIDPAAADVLLSSAVTCEICGAGGKLFPDHNHKTNGLRGALCGNCNRGLGLFFDNADSLFRAMRYLVKYA